MEDLFLSGELIIRVKNKEESGHLIALCQNHGFPKDPTNTQEIAIDSYIDYPYYFIEKQDQLQMNQTLKGAIFSIMEDSDLVLYKEFEEVYPNLKLKAI